MKAQITDKYLQIGVAKVFCMCVWLTYKMEQYWKQLADFTFIYLTTTLLHHALKANSQHADYLMHQCTNIALLQILWSLQLNIYTVYLQASVL